MTSRLVLSLSPVIALGPAVAVYAYAEVYMSEEKAPSLLFPGVKFESRTLDLDQKTIDTVEKQSGERVRSKTLKVYVGEGKQTVIIDQVVGKHEFITFAVGIGGDGQVRGIEILEYRETYGGQVREAAWKNQFIGKTKDSALKLNSDIRGISGATLSCVHVTGGVRRLLQTYDQIKAQI